MIISKTLNQQQQNDSDSEPHREGDEQFPQEKTDFCNVDINSVRSSESRSIGAEYVVAEQIKQYKFDDIL